MKGEELDVESQLNYFLNALEYYGEAGKEAKEAQSSGQIDQNERKKVLRLLETSYHQSKIVTDDVLATLHPDLPRHFRGQFVRALELNISGIKAAIYHPEEGAPDQTREQLELMDAWLDWFGEVGGSFSFPREFTRNKNP